MTALSRYRDWLTAEVKQAPDSCKPGLFLALIGLDMVESTPKADFCGEVSITLPDDVKVCWLAPRHADGHDFS